ncbi:putative membrane protein [Clostridium saccharoperbutylacetonicum]|uniref:YibE/F family protein n=1 Tax=Clostridium saccharoperbutylacetonicum N1-4(HMT) TaxID=931276 RepID=M1N2G3_9CLOT|nr:YibE/F family protein [Clostridium saccharoperbutylacetonicum]AGF57657.1 YibE/F family protein [Clostridium saccharoperbutylacetonicum N1-4(HMT)]NRT61575.1 putative membrane protein [Clostridium saccharoperbutylacetonicum]NSB24898.1 putative membrane protein [Clostridium saccharoperbutylacetonicum]NSB44269.1 putative membrane protein [Clostridium saccharoperbutylacetonicum]
MSKDLIKNIFNFRATEINKFSKKKLVLGAILIIISLISLFFISNNENFYDKPIGKVISIEEKEFDKKTDDGKIELMKNQKIRAIIMNGNHKGEVVEADNIASFSQVNDLNLKVNDQVFLSITDNDNHNISSVKITEFKRDKYIVLIMIIFIILILLIGQKKGLRSLASLIVNIIILLIITELFTKGYYLMICSIIASILFIIFSIVIVSGRNKKSFAAIVGTLTGTLISMIIAGVVIKINNWSGVHFEEMDFLTQPPETIFFIELIIGTLGAIMDIAISISSAVKELYDKNPNTSRRVIVRSAREIGQDIMGTMSNTLVFAYLSGSIPTILLFLRNGVPITYIVSIDLSLEYMRAIVGSIGIVLSIPITIYISILILKNHNMGEI